MGGDGPLFIDQYRGFVRWPDAPPALEGLNHGLQLGDADAQTVAVFAPAVAGGLALLEDGLALPGVLLTALRFVIAWGRFKGLAGCLRPGSDGFGLEDGARERFKEVLAEQLLVHDDEAAYVGVIGGNGPGDPHAAQVEAGQLFEFAQAVDAPHDAIQDQAHHQARGAHEDAARVARDKAARAIGCVQSGPGRFRRGQAKQIALRAAGRGDFAGGAHQAGGRWQGLPNFIIQE